MGEYLNGECPHCGQSIEYPSQGTGETVPCPTCHELFVLKPIERAPVDLSPLPPAAPAKMPPALPKPAVPVLSPPSSRPPTPAAPPADSTTLVLHGKPQPPAPLEQAFIEFVDDPAFAKHPPTREQVARAWASASFQKEDENEPPNHAEVAGALKKMFREFRSPKPQPGGLRTAK